MAYSVAIDGPAGSGKGTVTKKVAKEMGLTNIDTGATYRCVALAIIENNVLLEEKNKIIEIAKNIKIEFDGNQNVFLNGKNVTKKIRSKEVSDIVSQVSSIKDVRLIMVDLQRKLAQNKNVIMEGRDIATYVFPNANVKIYLDASLEERAKRRYQEMKEKNLKITYDEVLENIKMRDENDKNKEIGSLKIAEDATVIDTTNLSIQEVADKIKQIINKKTQY